MPHSIDNEQAPLCQALPANREEGTTHTSDRPAIRCHYFDEIKTYQRELERQNEELRRSQVNLEMSRYEYRQLFELAPIGYFVFDAHCIIHDVNLIGSNMLQAARRHVLHKSILDYMTPEYQGQFKKHLLHVIDVGARQSCDIALIRSDGLPYYVEIQSVPIANDEDDEVLIRSAMMDITVRRQMEEELIAEREKALQSVRFMNEFLANMSHEIRTPLAGVIGFAEVLEEELPHEHQEIAQLIASGGNRLLNTLNSVLDFAKLRADNHSLLLSSLNVVEFAEKQCKLLSSLADRKGLRIDFESDQEVHFAMLDPGSLDRILNNLIGNAIKYTNEGTIKVSLSATPKAIKLVIKDTGVGIDPKFLPYIFEPFRQEHMGDDRPFEGVGLGLTITKHLIDLMHGDINVVSQPNEGSTFTVTFPPIAKNLEALLPKSTKAIPDVENIPFPRLKTLVVEDNFETQLLAKRFLKPHCDVTLVDTYDTALLAFETGNFDVALLDINLGEKRTGTDLLQQLRAMQGKPNFYAVAFTAYALPTDRAQFMNQGFDDYLAKPFTKSDLIELLQRSSRLQSVGDGM